MESKLIQSDNFVNLQSKPNIPFMKELAFIILTAGCVISCTGTSEKQEKISGDTVRQSYEVSVGRPSGKVEIRLEKDTILPNENRVGLTIRNNSPHTIQTGKIHYFDRWNGKEWERVYPELTDDNTIITFDAIGYELSPGKELTLYARLYRFAYHYAAGKYRICWPITEEGKKRTLIKEVYIKE